MTTLLLVLLILSLIGCVFLTIMWMSEHVSASRQADEAEQARQDAEVKRGELEAELRKLQELNARLSKWTVVINAEDKARELIAEAQKTLAQAESDARILLTNAEEQYATRIEDANIEAAKATSEARAKAKQLNEEAQSALATATQRSAEIIVRGVPAMKRRIVVLAAAAALCLATVAIVPSGATAGASRAGSTGTGRVFFPNPLATAPRS
jgi:FtsZ-interacting cell division protein ZipA